MKRIVFCGGGTAGHVMPNIALIQRLRNKAQLYYIGTGGIEKELLSPYSAFITYEQINAPKLRRSFSAELFKLPFELKKSISASKALLSEIKPHIVMSKGGYASFPVVYAAKKLNITSFAHESDSSLGLANRLSLPLVQKLYSPFESTVLQAGKKGALSSTPLTEEMTMGKRADGLRLCGFKGNRPILLCLGGSLGALALNNALKSALPLLTKKFDVFAVTGRGKQIDYQSTAFNQIEFTHSLAHLYAAADIAFSRAGSNTLGELSYYKVPMLLTPLVNSSRGEQLKNAEHYKKIGVARILPEKEISSSRLVSELITLIDNSESIKKRFPDYQTDCLILNDILSIIDKD